MSLNLLNLNFRKIQYFLTVVEEGSITNAANKLYVTQPLLSKNISELERALDIRLFHRDKRLLELTEAGKYLYSNWKLLINQISDSIEEAGAIQRGSSETITVACDYLHILSASELWIGPISRYMADHPHIKANITSDDLGALKSKLINREYQLIVSSFHSAWGLDNRFCSKVIARVPSCFIVRKGHPFIQKHGKNFPFTLLKDQEFLCIHPHISKFPQDTFIAWCLEKGFRPRITGYMENQLNQILEVKASDKWLMSLELKSLMEDPALEVISIEDQITDIVLIWSRDSSKNVHDLTEYFPTLKA